MNSRVLITIVVLLVIVAGAVVMMKPKPATSDEHATTSAATHSHSPSPQKPRVPAFQAASEVASLPATLPAARFIGKTREAYQVAKEIPATLAQLPCYCECDRGYGHKSLHSCYVDDHASMCAVCVDEALLAYKLQKEEKLTPEQVRERIIEKYSAQQ